MPDGYKIAPHWHPKRENVTVISGKFKVGMGDKFEAGKMNTFPAGSFAYLDPEMHHYAMASGPTTVQVHGMLPLQFNYVNPTDDPSKKERVGEGPATTGPQAKNLPSVPKSEIWELRTGN